MGDLLRQLMEPFKPEHITWKPGATKGDRCLALAYADLRAYMERLDEVCDLDWSVEYMPWGNDRIIARLTIDGVTRASTGEMAKQDVLNEMGGTVAEAQAFKRAAAMFGMGRYLYDLPSVWVAFDAQAKKISKEGQTELDNRYKTWYVKTIAATPKQPVQDAPATSQTGKTTPKDDSAHESPPHNRLWGIGRAVFGPDWDMARPWIIRKWTEINSYGENIRESAKDLSDDQKSMLGDYINERATELQGIWPKQKAKMNKAQAAQQQADAVAA